VPEQIAERHVRSAWSLPVFATAVTFAFLVVASLSPDEQASALPSAPGEMPSQSFALGDDAAPGAARDDFAVSRIRTAPAIGKPDPGSAQAIAYDMVLQRGWGDDEYECLVALWNRESHWNVYAHNTSSGAYGIPQALPGDKMASVADDWQTNPATQITWGLGYITGRYGTPCGAWQHSESKGWY
jgi:hypothetical protein